MSIVSELYALAAMTKSHHLDEVVRIEQMSHSNPWSRDAFVHELETNTVSRSRVALTREGESMVAGYCIGWVVVDHLQIQNVAVHPSHRRRGLAIFLIEDALSDARKRGAEAAWLEVRQSNVSARRLYEGLGFREAGERKGYYSRPSEDAVVLQKELTREPRES